MSDRISSSYRHSLIGTRRYRFGESGSTSTADNSRYSSVSSSSNGSGSRTTSPSRLLSPLNGDSSKRSAANRRTASPMSPAANDQQLAATTNFLESLFDACQSHDDMKEIEGIDCFGDERSSLQEFERFYNNPQLSDVTLVVGEESFEAHKLILVKSSEVFERMFSQQWSGEKKEVELVEDRLCVRVFPNFLRYLYCSHIVLHYDNTLPILILADKYNVCSLRKVCLSYAVEHIVPNLPLKEVFHVWFQYGTKCFHHTLIRACVDILAQSFQEVMTNSDWEREWLGMDRDQLTEFLKSSELVVSGEFEIWQGLLRWLQVPSHTERQGAALERNLQQLVPLIRFPMMLPDELGSIEKCPLAEKHPKIFSQQLMQAYKFNSLPLNSRANAKEFAGTQFLLRNYTDLRWDKRIVIQNMESLPRFTEVALPITTKASAVPCQTWDWELKVHPKGYSQTGDDFRCYLSSNVILDQCRAVEFMLSIVDDKKILKSVVGKRNFNKTRYSADLETEKKIAVDELIGRDCPLICNDSLIIQLVLRPIE